MLLTTENLNSGHLLWLILIGSTFSLCSCSGNRGDETLQSSVNSEQKEHKVDNYTVGEFCFESDNLKRTTFLNGDEIPQAQSEKEWIDAGANMSPAWCYAKESDENGERQMLYNYYALSDERGLVEDNCELSPQTIDKLQNCLKEGRCSFIPDEPSAERNYLGKYYDLDVVNWWIKDSADEASVACWSKDGVELKIHKVSKSNGFYVRCLKK